MVAVSGRRRSPRIPPGVRYYADWRELLEAERPDIAVVATPPATHAEIACAAMDAGAHVIVEKPLATTLEDARRVIATRDRTGRRATVDLLMRYHPFLERLREITHAGILGRPFRVDVENYAQGESLPPDHWFWDRELSGGILVEHGVHFIDLVHYLCGDPEPRCIAGAEYTREDGLTDRMLAEILYEGGLLATHFHAFSRPGFLEVTVLRLAYDLGEVELRGWIPLSGRVRALVDRKGGEALKSLPNAIVEEERPVEEMDDASRPEGWGDEWPLPPPPGPIVRSGGREYRVEKCITLSLALDRGKREVYAECLRALMRDFLRWVEDPAHSPRVTLEDGLKSLRIALEATKAAEDCRK